MPKYHGKPPLGNGHAMGTFYNENNAYAAQWLRNLVAAGSLPAGTVDARSIAEIEPGDLAGYDSCHFFAGIGGWPYALELAGWPADRPVWTGSCPCQPFSAAGKQGGADDPRHLWPLWLRLIRVRRPDTILGEQVAGAVGFGWWDRVCADLEALQYACGAAVLGAHSVGAPHIRQRPFWVAHTADDGRHARPSNELQSAGRPALANDGSATGGMAPQGREGRLRGRPDQERQDQHRYAGCDGHADNPWADSTWLPCLDGKARRTQPSVYPLAHGIPNRVGQLRAYGNAIVPQTAALFITTVLQIT